MLWALSGSFKQRGDIFATPPSLIPDPPTLENYQNLLGTQPFWSWFGISIGTAGIATVVSVFVCAMAGYGFAKFRFRGKRILFAVMFSSLSVPFAVILIPLFILVVKSGLANPWFALIVPWVAPAFGIFMMQQFIVQAIPDGCSSPPASTGPPSSGPSAEWCCRCCVLRSGRSACGASSRATTASCGRW